MPLGTIYFNFGWERKSCSVDSKEDAVAKIREVLGTHAAYQDQSLYDRNLFCNTSKIELAGLGPEAAEWVARQITSVKLGS